MGMPESVVGVASASNAKSLHVLVVDDEPSILLTLRMLARSLRWTITCTSNPREAVELAQQVQPDVILSDYCMPECNGAELVKALRANGETKHIPIVVMSGNVTFSEVGVNFIEKPFGLQKLRTLMEYAASSAETGHRPRNLRRAEGSASGEKENVSENHR